MMEGRNMNTVDVMLDLETTGTRAGCGILSMGACTFNRERTFLTNISQVTCLDAGLTNDPSTLDWWSKQDKTVRGAAFNGDTPLTSALGAFSDWLRTLGVPKNKVYVWGNSARFDLGILEAAYAACNMDYPIDYKNERCYRTLKNLYFNIKAEPFQGVKHDPLADALNQAAHASAILRKHFSVIKEM
jgi:hypothetical protein